jgi:ring-1,2-phenylacetyl-CoA epoxidase subunit PaaC
LFDAAEHTLMGSLVKSSYQPLADAAAKVQREEFYHLRHTQAWVRRLGLGTDESNQRMQAALDTLWPYFIYYFLPLSMDDRLAKAGIIPSADRWQVAWEADVLPLLKDINLKVPSSLITFEVTRTHHSEHLTALLNEMQSVARLQPDAKW